MSNYTTSNQKIEALIEEVFTLNRQDRHVFIQKIFFGLIKHDNSILIPMLHKAGISAPKIADALGVDSSLLYRDYLKKEDK